MKKGLKSYIKSIILFSIIVFPLKLNSTNDSINYANTYRLIDSNFRVINQNLHLKSDTLLNLAKQTLDLSLTNNYKEGINKAYFYVARIYDLQNNKDSAIFFYESGLKYNFTDNDLKADYLSYLTDAYRFVGNYFLALEKCLSLKELVETNKTKKYSYELYDMLAFSYQSLMEYNLALENFKKSAELALKNGDEASAGVTYANIGGLLYELNQLEESLKYLKKGSFIEEKYKLEYAGNSYSLIGSIYLKTGLLDSAEIYLQKAAFLNRINNYEVGIALTNYQYGNYFFKKKEYNKATDYLNKVIDYTFKTNLSILLKDSYKLLAEVNFAQGNYKDAYHNLTSFFDTYTKLYDIKEINKAKAFEQKLIQQEKEGELFVLKIEKQKTINSLLIVIVSLILIVGIIILIYLFQFKKLNRELIKSKNKAEESDRLKSKFLQTISHEIRTPLNGIIGFSEMILSKSLSEEELGQINDLIIKNSNDLISTIENLVDIAHLTTNQYNIKKSKFELIPVLENIVSQAKDNVDYKNKKDLKIELKFDDKVQLYSDKTIISKIILHLVKNAILYTEKGSVTIGYKKESTNIILYVNDTGIGIPPEKIDLIFSPFQQADENINIKLGGTGLGLTIVNGLIQILGGKIWVGSELHKGSTFFISLPLK